MGTMSCAARNFLCMSSDARSYKYPGVEKATVSNNENLKIVAYQKFDSALVSRLFYCILGCKSA